MQVPFIDIHTHRLLPPSIDTFAIQSFISGEDRINTSLPFSVGVHPWHLPEETAVTSATNSIAALADTPNCIAIGECGLDKLYPAYERQRELFRFQVGLAAQFKLPIVIHMVGSADDILAEFKYCKEAQTRIIHGFRGGAQQAEQFIKKGFSISIGEHFDPHALQIAHELDALLLETDDSHLSIHEVYNNVANSLHISLKELQIEIAERATRLLPKICPLLA